MIAAAVTGITTSEEACLLWMRAMAAVHLCGKGKAMTLAQGAAAITDLGLPTTAAQMADAGKNARKRGAGKLVKPPEAMARFLTKIETRFAPTSFSKHGVTLIAKARTLMKRA